MDFIKAFFLVYLLSVFSPVSEAHDDFLGLNLGMTRESALTVLHKPASALRTVKPSQEQIVTDTFTMPSCSLPLRRTVGFDTSGKLCAVGLTYKTTADQIQQAHDCALNWLTQTYGPSGKRMQPDSTIEDVWQLGPACLTLETKQYNPHDYFVLIYYYSSKEFSAKE
ncbi:MAG TPA: hypothetical protein VG537_04655 [Candidatus Kapabacteria bacterium]|jgi:hypothetical protein|nr:hypothetical protein [Candidatus Kapabacteria bacterium]